MFGDVVRETLGPDVLSIRQAGRAHLPRSASEAAPGGPAPGLKDLPGLEVPDDRFALNSVPVHVHEVVRVWEPDRGLRVLGLGPGPVAEELEPCVLRTDLGSQLVLGEPLEVGVLREDHGWVRR